MLLFCYINLCLLKKHDKTLDEGAGLEDFLEQAILVNAPENDVNEQENSQDNGDDDFTEEDDDLEVGESQDV